MNLNINKSLKKSATILYAVILSESVVFSTYNLAIVKVSSGLINLVHYRGKAYAINVLKSRVQKTLIDMGLKRAGYLLTGAMEFALDFTSPGSAIGKYIDKHDKKPDNGYIELT